MHLRAVTSQFTDQVTYIAYNAQGRLPGNRPIYNKQITSGDNCFYYHKNNSQHNYTTVKVNKLL